MEENQLLLKETKENIASMVHTIQSEDMEIRMLWMELEWPRRQVIIPIINTLPFENLLSCSQVVEEELYAVQLQFYIKVEIGFFIQF